ncbi:dynein light chain 1, cytoplasmic [Drosophila grimshawi]|uniref:Dynein light chain n=1 Tax=Drosophila grimshawi TaxID=7222 RepID=B4JA79_DROGR|nr:dynein light chain 1, cytoplasmic [Drosophila grimshawi]EDW03753.1 GH11409 [Drosophila grimshawi]
MTDAEAVIITTDMCEEMQNYCIHCANEALEIFNTEKDIAVYIKNEFDSKYCPSWQCIVGHNFGLYVTHETSHFIHFNLNGADVLLFKSC